MTYLVFYLFYGLSIVSAIFVAFTRHVLHAAFALMACFLGLAALFVFAGAEFLAVVQIMVYVGGVLVLLVFGVMLTTRLEGKPVRSGLVQPLGAGLVAVVSWPFFFSVFIRGFCLH
ncbi:MAG: hypothetical protein HC842_02315 [Cytophagales bacterium]|nr:hypothetical protein [Cytophagales bacterium]